MDDRKLEKFLSDLRRRLKSQPAFHDQFTGQIQIPVFQGGLSGAIRFELVDHQPKNGELKIG